MASNDLAEQVRLEQAERHDQDAWQPVIERWAEGRESVSIEKVLTERLDKARGYATRQEPRGEGPEGTGLGPKRRPTNGDRRRRYFRQYL